MRMRCRMPPRQVKWWKSIAWGSDLGPLFRKLNDHCWHWPMLRPIIPTTWPTSRLFLVFGHGHVSFLFIFSFLIVTMLFGLDCSGETGQIWQNNSVSFSSHGVFYIIYYLPIYIHNRWLKIWWDQVKFTSLPLMF